MELEQLQIYHLRDLEDDELETVMEQHPEHEIRNEAFQILNYRKLIVGN